MRYSDKRIAYLSCVRISNEIMRKLLDAYNSRLGKFILDRNRIINSAFIVVGCYISFLMYCSAPIEYTHATRIIPHPQELSIKDSSLNFIIDANTTIVTNESLKNSFICELLNEKIVEKNGVPLSIEYVGDCASIENAIVIGTSENGDTLLDSLALARNMLVSPPYLREEEYRLEVDSLSVVVLGKDERALFYGLQTLCQLLEKGGSPNTFRIPAVRIRDFPDMPIRGVYYGFHLGNLDDQSLLERGYEDIRRFSQFKLNMIGLDNHHYGHLEREVPDGSGDRYWQRFAELFDFSRQHFLEPRVGGWTRWFGGDSVWDDDITALECIRTSQQLKMEGTKEYPLRISTGQVAHKVLYDLETGTSWEEEPVVVSDISGQMLYQEQRDYTVTFGPIRSPYYDTVIAGEGEPQGYPKRRGESAEPPTLIRRTNESRIRDGQTVRIAFSYIGPDPWSPAKVRYCRSDPDCALTARRTSSGGGARNRWNI